MGKIKVESRLMFDGVHFSVIFRNYRYRGGYSEFEGKQLEVAVKTPMGDLITTTDKLDIEHVVLPSIPEDSPEFISDLTDYLEQWLANSPPLCRCGREMSHRFHQNPDRDEGESRGNWLDWECPNFNQHTAEIDRNCLYAVLLSEGYRDRYYNPGTYNKKEVEK